MLQIITGRSGSGKTDTIHQMICRHADERPIVLLVPEQSTYQNEKRILDTLGAQAAAGISVLSFKRLYDWMAEQTGRDNLRRIDDGVRAVLMSLATESVSDRLMLYGTRSRRSDFAQLMVKAVSEFKLCAITPEQLSEAALRTDNVRLSRKLSESAVIFAAYEALLSGAYADPDDDLRRLRKMLCEQPFFEGKTVYIDSFNGFSAQELQIIELILRQADKVIVALCCDNSNAREMEHSIFRESDLTLRQLTAMAGRLDISIAPTLRLPDAVRYRSASLAAVEESVFRFDGDPYLLEDDAVQLYEAEDEYDEIRQTAREISRLVREEDYAYRDITIILRQPDMYKSVIASEFAKFNIPYFLSDPTPLEEKPLIRLILSALELVHSSFNTESILTYLKTGLTNLSEDEVFALENYVYLWDIKGSRWKAPFTMNPDGNSDTLNEEELQGLEELRCRVMEPLLDFSSRLSKAENGGEISKAIYLLLERIGTSARLKELVSRFSGAEEAKQKETEARIWDVTMNLLDKMYTTLVNTKVDSRRYLELFRMMIRHNPLSDIPQTLDHVVVGTAGSLRSQSQRAVFVIGAAEGIFPAVPEASGLFSDSERTTLIQMELPLYDAVYGMSLKEKFNAYMALSMPSERLYVSMHRNNTKGERCEPSAIIRELQAIFPEISLRRRSNLPTEALFYTEEQSFEELASMWADNTSAVSTLREYFGTSPAYASRYDAIGRLLRDEPFRIQASSGAQKLFGNKLTLSASQAETYYLCPFRYFCRYGLKAYPRRRASMDAGLYGSAVHYILEKLLRQESFEELKTADDDTLRALIRRYISAYLEEIGGTQDRSGRFMAQFSLIEKNMTMLLRRLIAEFRVSRFEPADFELTIGEGAQIPEYELSLPGGERIGVTGMVDRVDTYVHNGEKYIRIVDYKTGNKKFRLSDILYGLNLQMLLYLSIIEKNGTARYSEGSRYELAPAGILYMPSTPQSKTGDFYSEKNRSESLKTQQAGFKMNGLLINDPEILSAMEEGVQGVFIPARMGADGKLQQAEKSFTTLEDYGRIFAFLDQKLMEMAQQLFDGNVERNPVKGTSQDACEYCDYRSVCGFENGKKTRRIVGMSQSEAMEIIREEGKAHE